MTPASWRFYLSRRDLGSVAAFTVVQLDLYLFPSSLLLFSLSYFETQKLEVDFTPISTSPPPLPDQTATKSSVYSVKNQGSPPLPHRGLSPLFL